mmetsp:Transcript_21447/g.52789  ORF Transcript_21447/g.52789 Transcript_21447/m.52789 type:complete len:108 (+) Transcript_21447:257-580(+)
MHGVSCPHRAVGLWASEKAPVLPTLGPVRGRGMRRVDMSCRAAGRGAPYRWKYSPVGRGFDVRDERVCAAAAPSGKGKGEAAILKDEGSGCFLGCLECEWLAESRHD